jgi:hypothetical protein
LLVKLLYTECHTLYVKVLNSFWFFYII